MTNIRRKSPCQTRARRFNVGPIANNAAAELDRRPAADPLADQVESTTRQYNALRPESKRLFWTVNAAARAILLNVPHLTIVL